GATPYATVSSRISQHFKRILEHIPPRPPILGRVAHEKHTRKYFYYVASAQEQEDFLHKVRIGLIPTHSATAANGGSGKNGANGGGSGQRKSKSTKKTRCMVPAVAVEPDLSPIAAMRRSRRAASADTAVGTGMQAIDRSSFQGEASLQRRSSSRQTPSSTVIGSTRPRRTSYDGGTSHRISELQNGRHPSDSESDSNPYARKRYRSVKSAVALAHPRRRLRAQAQADLVGDHRGRNSVPAVVSSMAPRARRSASYGDTQIDAMSQSRRGIGQAGGAGKWRPSCTSDEDAQCDGEKTDGSHSSHSSISDHDAEHSEIEVENEEDSCDSSDDDNIDGAENGILDRENGSLSASDHIRRGSDNLFGSVAERERRRQREPSTDTALIPPVPNTTPRASASPDTTPFPPATSPSFHPRCLCGDSNNGNIHHNCISHNNSSGSGSELQVASPLLLPRGLMSLQMPLDSIFGTSPIAGKDIIPSPAEMLTPVVAAASVLLPPEDSVVPVTHSPSLISTELGLVTQSHEKIEGINSSDFVKHNTTPEHAGSPPEPAATSETSVASTATEEVLGSLKQQAKGPAELLSAVNKAAIASCSDAEKGDRDRDDYDFSFHDLMDAELMSINELDKLWTNCHPSDDESHVEKPCSGLSTIPEVAMEDLCDGAETAEALVKAAADCQKDELSTKLTQKLLALSGTNSAATNDASLLPCRSKIRNNNKSAESKSSETPPHSPLSQKSLADELPAEECVAASKLAVQPGTEPAISVSVSDSNSASDAAGLDSLESTKVLVNNTDEHEESTSSSSKVILPDPFGDIPATAMVATKMPVSPRIVLTIVETVPVYMTVITTTEEAGPCTGKWIVRRHRLLRLVENGYVNASSLLLAGGVSSEQERSIVLSLEVGRFKWRRPQSKLYGTWIPLPRARALAATCSLNHRLGPFLNDNLESYFPAPLPTSFIRHLIAPFFTDPAGMLLATADSDAGLGIEFQNLVNSTTANHRPAQSISRSSTFGATARGAPSPSIIQTLAGRPGSFSFGGAAKSIFGSDDRQLQSLLHLLSAESPMLGISGSNERSEALHAEPEAEDEALADVKADGERGAGVLDSTKDESGADKSGDKIQEGNDEKLESKPEGKPGSGTTNAELDIKPEQRQGSDAKAHSETSVYTRAGSESASDAIAKTANQHSIAEPNKHLSDGDATKSSISSSEAKVLHSGQLLAEACSDEFKQAVAGSGKETGTATPKVATSVTSLGVDAHKLAEAISSTLALSTGLNGDMDCDDDMDLDMSMVFPGSDNDVDMICCSTPPSPPPPPSLPVRQRRISNAPLTIPRTLSPAMSARSMDGASTSGCEDALDDLDPLDGSRSRIHSRAQSPQGQEQQQPPHEHQRQQSQQQQQQRSPHSGGSFNARLAQTMEAFGFTGAAKTSLLLRLRAAAAAKSTGRQQAVAPYMLYRNSNSSVANSGSAGSSIKRGKTLACIDEDESLSAGGSSVRKRARVVRIPRVKPLAKSKVKARSAPDASVVMRLASAIYNHTLNMATLAQAQRQTAAAPGDGSTAGTSTAPVPAPALASAQALASATTKATTPTSVTSASKSAGAALAASPRAHNPVARSTGGSSPSAVRPPQQQRYNSPVYNQQHQQQQQQQQQQRVSSPIGQRMPVRPGTAPSTPNQNGQPLLNRPGTTPTRPPIRRPVMRPGIAGSGASSPGNMGSPSPRLMQQQRPMMVRRPPPNGAPHTPPSGGPVRFGQSGRPPTPGSAGQHARPFPRPAGAAPGSGLPGTPLRRPPPPSAQQGMGVRPGAPCPRPIPGRPNTSASGIAVQRPRPPMLNGARPRPAMARQPPLAHQGGGANVRPGTSAGIIARPQQQVCSAQGPVTPVTPTSSSLTAGQQAGAVRPRPQPLQKPHPQLHQPPLQSPPKSHPQLPKTPVSATLASSRLAGAASPSAPSTPTAVAAAPTAPSPVANKNAD
ncbi:hypothetical protein H4R99_004547, partial [Coemansia sp. RSA 1722]